MANEARNRKIADQIQRELSELIRLGLRDPRISMVTITDVEVARDLSHAKVFFTSLGNEAQIESCLHGLTSAAGFLRGQLSKRMTTRVSPALAFAFDGSIDNGVKLSKLIAEAVADDARNASAHPSEHPVEHPVDEAQA